MKQSTQRILTTHTGSLPRPPELLPYLTGEGGTPTDDVHADDQIRAAVRDAVERQVAAGIDVVSDGEMGKSGFAHYVADRLTGFQGTTAVRPFAPRDLADYPEVGRRLFSTAGEERPRPPMPTNDGPIVYVGQERLAADLDNLAGAVAGKPVSEAFLPAISPGCVAFLMGTTYFPTRRDLVFALADGLRVEYRGIVERGFLLQIDCP